MKFVYYIPKRLFLILFLIPFFTFADHIVGGNIEMIALDKTPGRYKIVVKIYYDRLKVASTTYNYPIRIYRKRDKEPLHIFPVLRIDSKRQLVKFTNEKCAEQNKLEVVLDYFEAELKLNPNEYNDPDGYVLVINECCRSAAITNIKSPERRGIPFYTEFSPLLKNGKPFVDSTPEFDEIDGEYVCLGDDFTYSFDATDRDGDELRYSLVMPMNIYDKEYGASYSGLINTEFIEWQTGYSATNAIKGNPALQIDAKTGELSVRATEVGLFTFTVLVEEYRNGEKIGATRRDYQLFVFDCPPLIPPDPTITINDQPANDVSVCQGGAVTLKATVNPNWGYQWKRDGDNIPNATTPVLTLTEAGTYQLVTYLENTCSKTRRSRKVKVDFTNSNFKLKTNGAARVCSGGGSFTLETPENSNYTYEWYRDGQQLAAATQFTFKPTEAGRYWALVRDAAIGCSSRSDTVAVQSVTPLAVSINSSAGFQICAGTATTLSVSNNAAQKTYQWRRNDREMPNETKSTLVVSEAGDYKVALIDTNGCVNSASTVKVEMVDKITVTLDSIPNFCGVGFPPVALQGTPTGGTYAGNGVSNNQFEPPKAGIGTHQISYSIKGALACQQGEAKRTVVITPPPVLNLGPDRELFKGAAVELNGDLGAGYVYNWTPPASLSDPSMAKTQARPEATTTYTLRATGPNGCVAEDTITVRVITTIYIPDVFTPNGDGINDVWKLRGLENYPEAEVSIFNRWGNLVFFGKGNGQKQFDGTFNDNVLTNGVYIYQIKTLSAGGYTFRGSVILMR